jgi:hypothetical protein
VCQAGNKVVFDEDGSYILNKKTGKTIKVRMDNGNFEFDLWVSKAKPVKNQVTFEGKNRFKALESSDEEMPQLVESEDEDNDRMVEMVFMRQD